VQDIGVRIGGLGFKGSWFRFRVRTEGAARNPRARLPERTLALPAEARVQCSACIRSIPVTPRGQVACGKGVVPVGLSTSRRQLCSSLRCCDGVRFLQTL